MNSATSRIAIYNRNYPMIGVMAVHERLVWDGRLKRNVWAHPNFAGYIAPEIGDEQ
jgi:hypothetical protein